MEKFQVRHGDLLLERIDSIPKGAKERNTNVILDGEVTGHAHRLIGGAILDHEDRAYLSVPKTATVIHEEHNTITLPPGDYVVTRQREYNPYERAARNVVD
jgi:hypothetical protein